MSIPLWSVLLGCGDVAVQPDDAGQIDAGAPAPDAGETVAPGTATWLLQATAGGPSNSVSIDAVAVSPTGDLVVAGLATGQPIGIAGMLASPDPGGLIIAKLSGTPRTAAWLWPLSCSGWNQEVEIGVDDNGDVLLALDCGGRIYIDGLPLDSVAGTRDLFLVKLASSNGLVRWFRHIGSDQIDAPLSLALDSNGDLLVSGFFGGVVDFGDALPLDASAGSGFVVKYAGSDGKLVWKKQLAASIGGLAVDPSDNVIATGMFYDPVSIDGYSHTSVGGADALLVKLAGASGQRLFSLAFGEANDDGGQQVAVDSTGNIYLAATFFGAVAFGGAPLTAPDFGVAIAKYSPSGAHIWSLGGNAASSIQSVTGLAIDGRGDLTLVGSFQGSLTFATATLTSASTKSDGYLVALRGADGGVRWSKRLGGLGYDATRAVAVDSANNVYAAGLFSGAADFDDLSLTGTGLSDGFLAGFSP